MGGAGGAAIAAAPAVPPPSTSSLRLDVPATSRANPPVPRLQSIAHHQALQAAIWRRLYASGSPAAALILPAVPFPLVNVIGTVHPPQHFSESKTAPAVVPPPPPLSASIIGHHSHTRPALVPPVMLSYNAPSARILSYRPPAPGIIPMLHRAHPPSDR